MRLPPYHTHRSSPSYQICHLVDVSRRTVCIFRELDKAPCVLVLFLFFRVVAWAPVPVDPLPHRHIAQVCTSPTCQHTYTHTHTPIPTPAGSELLGAPLPSPPPSPTSTAFTLQGKEAGTVSEYLHWSGRRGQWGGVLERKEGTVGGVSLG